MKKSSALSLGVFWVSLVLWMWICLFLGVFWVKSAKADDKGTSSSPRVIYPKKTDLDFEGTQIEGELRSPGEFYFTDKPDEKFDSLVKRRKNFHREMLRDVVMSR